MANLQYLQVLQQHSSDSFSHYACKIHISSKWTSWLKYENWFLAVVAFLVKYVIHDKQHKHIGFWEGESQLGGHRPIAQSCQDQTLQMQVILIRVQGSSSSEGTIDLPQWRLGRAIADKWFP